METHLVSTVRCFLGDYSRSAWGGSPQQPLCPVIGGCTFMNLRAKWNLGDHLSNHITLEMRKLRLRETIFSGVIWPPPPFFTISTKSIYPGSGDSDLESDFPVQKDFLSVGRGAERGMVLPSSGSSGNKNLRSNKTYNYRVTPPERLKE